MKLLFYINTLHRGGAERVFANLANAFAANGDEVIFVTSFRDSEWEYSLNNEVGRYSIEEREISQSYFKRNLSRYRALRKIISETQPEVVFSTSPEANFRALFAAIRKKTKSIITIISTPEHEYKKRVYKILAKTLYRYADTIVCQTKYEMDWFSKPIRRKSVILFNQVDDKFYHIENQGKRSGIVSTGRLIASKRHDMTIQAFSKLANHCDDNLTIYGEGSCRDELLALIKELKMENRIFLPGRIDDVAKEICGAKIYVISSEYEGVSNALMEAMALGLPCITTDSGGGGAKMLSENGHSAALIPVNDETELYNAMQKLLTDEALAAEYGRKAQIRAEDFRADTVFKQWRQLAVDVCNSEKNWREV